MKNFLRDCAARGVGVARHVQLALLAALALVFSLSGEVFAQTSTVPELLDAETFTDFVSDMIAYIGPILIIVIGAALAVKGLRILVRWLMGAFSK